MKKKLTLTVLLILILTTISSTGVYAGFQAVPKVDGSYTTTYSWSEFLIKIRQMEEAGQGMGLTETVDTETGLSAESNGIDVHMTKNTEAGAAALLGASDYGKQGVGIESYMYRGQDVPTTNTEMQKSTTGNTSGVYNVLGSYSVAGAKDTYLDSNLSKLAERYVNRYTLDESSAKVGDATIETKYWRVMDGQTPAFEWITEKSPIFYRVASASYGDFGVSYSNDAPGASWVRACIVVGSGF